MKNFFLKVLLLGFLSINLNSNSLEINSTSSTVFVVENVKDCQNLLNLDNTDNLEKLNISNEIKGNRKKRREKLAAIFWGLANAVSSIAQAANASGKDENPAEGVTNFIANVFNTVAQVSQIEANYSKKPELVPLRNQLIFDLLVNIIESLYCALDEDDGRFISINNYPLLSELNSTIGKDERASWISMKILENGFVQAFIEESLDFVEYFLHQKVDDFVDFLRLNLLIKE